MSKPTLYVSNDAAGFTDRRLRRLGDELGLEVIVRDHYRTPPRTALDGAVAHVWAVPGTHAAALGADHGYAVAKGIPSAIVGPQDADALGWPDVTVQAVEELRPWLEDILLNANDIDRRRA